MTPTKTVRRRTPGSAVVAKLLQYLVLKDEAKTTNDRLTSLKKELAQVAIDGGEKDDKGHLNYLLPEPVEYAGKSYPGFQQQRRVSQGFDTEAAEELLRRRGLYERAIVIREEIDQDKVYVLNQEGLLSDDELDSLFTESETFAFKPLVD